VPATPEFHPEARAEFDRAADRYEQQRSGLGLSFVAAVQSTVSRCAEAPQQGAPLGSMLRRMFVPHFPFFVLYSSAGTAILIVAVAHFRRRPGYWSDRL